MELIMAVSHTPERQRKLVFFFLPGLVTLTMATSLSSMGENTSFWIALRVATAMADDSC